MLVADEPAPVRPRDDGSARRLRRALVALAIGAVAALAAVAFVAWSNYDRADRWERRAVRLQHNADELNTLLIDRSDRLNARTRELNAMALKVTEAENSIVRSEADVSALEQRQRELANEKAQVEDERAAMAEERDAITGVASAYIACKKGLVDLLQYVANDDYASANSYADSVDSDCSDADSSLQSYLAAYGG
jgi:septal ring factor EnvC (AmiA/AmiB activator)